MPLRFMIHSYIYVFPSLTVFVKGKYKIWRLVLLLLLRVLRQLATWMSHYCHLLEIVNACIVHSMHISPSVLPLFHQFSVLIMKSFISIQFSCPVLTNLLAWSWFDVGRSIFANVGTVSKVTFDIGMHISKFNNI